MICTNKNCQKKINEPLELFSGDTACPHCKTKLSVVPKFAFTKRNDELFTLSELYFLRYLSPDSYNEKAKKLLSVSRAGLLSRAIEFCTAAVKEGNPKAVSRMAYYNEHYLEKTRSESDRIRLAFEYYYAICSCQATNVTTEKGVKGFTEVEFQAFKKQAAVSMAKLFYLHPHVFKGRSRYESKKVEIEAIYGTLSFSSSDESRTVTNKAKYLHGILLSCFGKERAPLFGLYKICGGDLRELFEKMNMKSTKFRYDFSKLLSKGVEMRYTLADNKGMVSEDSYFSRFASDSAVRDLLSTISDSDSLYLYFFNTHGKHQYLSEGQMNRVKKDIAKENHSLLIELIDYSARDYLFYDDDIHFFKKGWSAKGCAKKLVESVIKED